MNNQERKVMYLYNIEQVSFYISQGCKPINTGIHPQTKMVWNKFYKDETEQAYNLWMNRNR